MVAPAAMPMDEPTAAVPAPAPPAYEEPPTAAAAAGPAQWTAEPVATPMAVPASDTGVFSPPGGAPAGAPWGGQPVPMVVARDDTVRNRSIGAGILILGLAVLIWGVGASFAVAQAYSTPALPHWEQISRLLTSIGLILAGLVIIYIGAVFRRS
jgi:hypothetical protein